MTSDRLRRLWKIGGTAGFGLLVFFVVFVLTLPYGRLKDYLVALAAQQGFEEPRRFVDPQLHQGRLATGVFDVHGTLALHPGERADVHHLPAVGQFVAHDITRPPSEAVGGRTVSCRSDRSPRVKNLLHLTTIAAKVSVVHAAFI